MQCTEQSNTHGVSRRYCYRTLRLSQTTILQPKAVMWAYAMLATARRILLQALEIRSLSARSRHILMYAMSQHLLIYNTHGQIPRILPLFIAKTMNYIDLRQAVWQLAWFASLADIRLSINLIILVVVSVHASLCLCCLLRIQHSEFVEKL